MESMLRDIAEYLVKLGQGRPRYERIYDSETFEVFLVGEGDGRVARQVFDKPRPSRSHLFETVEGFLAFLNSEHARIWGTRPADMDASGAVKPGVVFTGAAEVIADMDYGARIHQRARLKLQDTEEYRALRYLLRGEIFEDESMGLSQKQLWRLLISGLNGCIDPALLMAIGSLEMSADSEAKCKISLAGATAEKTKRNVVRVTFGEGASASTDLPLDWEWKGRIWDCFDREFTVPLRIELNNDDGLRFLFHARRLESVLIDARAQLTEAIRNGLPDHMTCYQAIL